MRCSICGTSYNHYGIFSLHPHHVIKSQHYDKDPQWFIDNGIDQKVMPMCAKCHDIIHHSTSDDNFNKQLEKAHGRKFNLNRYDYLWNRKEYLARL